MYDTYDTPITVYTYSYDGASDTDKWERHNYDKCSWYGGQKAAVGDSGLNTADSYTVRILPQSYDGAYISAGDIVVKGEYSADIQRAEDIPREAVKFVVTGFYDNRRGVAFMQHLKIEGK